MPWVQLYFGLFCLRLTTSNSQFIRSLFDAYTQIFYYFKLLIKLC